MTQPNEYDIGDRAVLRFGFTSRPLTAAEAQVFLSTGALPVGIGVDPDDVVCTVRKPDNTTVEPAVTGANGVYTAQVDLDQKGDWWYAADGTGGFKAAGERQLKVRPQRVPRA